MSETLADFDRYCVRGTIYGAPSERYAFPNGYGASVVHHSFCYGGYELAVIAGDTGVLCYDTPVTDDVVGYLDDEKCARLLAQIMALPRRTELEAQS